jgi:2-oxoglutarate ferredoxin oxidoreductase subunit alpha
VLLLPEDPHECFEFAAQAFDLADRLQTPVFVMTDLDIGMNQRLCEPFTWDDARRYDRGKVMTAEELEAGGVRPLPRRRRRRHPVPHLPGTHPTKGAYFTRGTSRTATRATPRSRPDYVDNMQRLLRSSTPPKTLVPQAGRCDRRASRRASA